MRVRAKEEFLESKSQSQSKSKSRSKSRSRSKSPDASGCLRIPESGFLARL